MFNTLKKKVLLVFVLSFVLLGCVCAKVSYSPSLQFYTGGSFTVPTADYLKVSQGKALPMVRTSADIGADVMALSMRISKFTFGAGFSFLYNTKSLVAGVQFLRPYIGIGASTGFKYHFASSFSLGFKFRYLFCKYWPYNNRFDIIETDVVPSFDVISTKRVNAAVIIPTTFTYKSDSVSMRVGVGMDVQVNFYLGAKNEEK